MCIYRYHLFLSCVSVTDVGVIYSLMTFVFSCMPVYLRSICRSVRGCVYCTSVELSLSLCMVFNVLVYLSLISLSVFLSSWVYLPLVSRFILVCVCVWCMSVPLHLDLSFFHLSLSSVSSLSRSSALVVATPRPSSWQSDVCDRMLSFCSWGGRQQRQRSKGDGGGISFLRSQHDCRTLRRHHRPAPRRARCSYRACRLEESRSLSQTDSYQHAKEIQRSLYSCPRSPLFINLFLFFADVRGVPVMDAEREREIGGWLFSCWCWW